MRISSKWGKFWYQVKFDLKGQSQLPQKNNRDLNQGLLHLWSKFGDPNLNGSRVIVRTSKWLTHRLTHTHTDTHTDAGDDNTRRPKLALVKSELPWDVNYGAHEMKFACMERSRIVCAEYLIYYTHDSLLFCFAVVGPRSNLTIHFKTYFTGSGPRFSQCHWNKPKYPRWQSSWDQHGLTWVLSAPDGPHVGPMNLAIREVNHVEIRLQQWW